jgi:hypothetical protein
MRRSWGVPQPLGIPIRLAANASRSRLRLAKFAGQDRCVVLRCVWSFAHGDL